MVSQITKIRRHEKIVSSTISPERIRDEKLADEALAARNEAVSSYATGEDKLGIKHFQEALALNRQRDNIYRFEQAVDIFLDFRGCDPEHTNLNLTRIITEQFNQGTFEQSRFLRELLVYALKNNDEPLMDLTEELIGDYHTIAAVHILVANQEDSQQISRNYLNRALFIINAIESTPKNQTSLQKRRLQITSKLEELD